MRWCAAIAVVLLAPSAMAGATPPPKLISNRETFDVSLERTAGYVVAARGRTVIEFHSGCSGYSTLQRSLSDVTDKDGDVSRGDFVVKVWESRDNRTMRFTLSNRTDGKLTEQHTGMAMLAANGGGAVKFTSHDQTFALPSGTMFPTAQTFEILRAAENGKTTVSRTIFQGGGKDGLLTATATIGARTSKTVEHPRDPAGVLKGVAAWPVLISYFSGDAQSPDSEIATRLYADGLLGSMSLIYPEYTLRATLVRVERLPSSC
jgi:hypothetical protein